MSRVRTLVLLVSFVALASCQTAPAPIVQAPPPPPPAEPPPLIYLPKEKALAAVVFEEAAAFSQTMQTLASLPERYGAEAEVAEAMRRGTGFEAIQLQRGAVAFVAVSALGHPGFADGFRPWSIDDEGRRDLAERILERPDWAASFPHADEAAGLAIAELDAVGGDAWARGLAVREAAYAVQAEAWSTVPSPMLADRLDQARRASAQRISAAPDAIERLRRTALTDPPISLIPRPQAGPYTAVVDRGLALAALAALGEAGEDRRDAVETLLGEPATRDCLESAKLMLLQCLASADRGPYEDLYCLGRHAAADTGQCIVKAAGASNPSFVPPPPPLPPAVAATSGSKARPASSTRR